MKNPDIVEVNTDDLWTGIWPQSTEGMAKLGHTVREQFKRKLSERLINPRVPAAKLHGHNTGRYKIKLRASGYRLVYQVIDEKVVLLVISVGKRGSDVYHMADTRYFKPVK